MINIQQQNFHHCAKIFIQFPLEIKTYHLLYFPVVTRKKPKAHKFNTKPTSKMRCSKSSLDVFHKVTNNKSLQPRAACIPAENGGGGVGGVKYVDFYVVQNFSLYMVWELPVVFFAITSLLVNFFLKTF